MNIIDINKLPTKIGLKHESTLRAYQILLKVKYYLEVHMPPSVILELIEEMEEPYKKEVIVL